MIRSVFEVTGPNAGVLLTVAEARAALGLEDDSRDADLTRLVARISASIFVACNLRTDGINPPTLLSEEITEHFRLVNAYDPLLLSRRRVTEVASVTEAGADVADSAYAIDRASGQLMRLSSDVVTTWACGMTVVEYVAGLETVPADLKFAAETWLRSLWRDSYETPGTISDPFVKVDDIPGVRRIERWVPAMNTSVSASTVSLVPPEVRSILVYGGYVETWIA